MPFWKPSQSALIRIWLELSFDEKDFFDPADELKVGDEVKVKILKIDADSHKISLSAKEGDSASSTSGGAPAVAAAAAPAVPSSPSEPLSKYEQDGKMSLGDVIDLSALSFGKDKDKDKGDDDSEEE